MYSMRVALIFIGLFLVCTLVFAPIGIACFISYWLLGKLESKRRKTYKTETLLEYR